MKVRQPALLWMVALSLACHLGSAPPAHGQASNNVIAAPRPPMKSSPREELSPFDFFGLFRRQNVENAVAEPQYTSPSVNYCVRTCDGKFFPVYSGASTNVSAVTLCAAMCPSAKTKIFSGTSIDKSIATDGTKYMSLPNALAYRTNIVLDCSCNGRDPFGVVSVDLENDPTLRTGDVVVRPDGIAVFLGGATPYKSTAFIPFRKARTLSPALLKQLSAIAILPNNPSAPHSITVRVRLTPPELLEKTIAPATVVIR